MYTTERQVDLIQDGIDVALRVGDIVHESMVARRMLSYSHVLVASPTLVGRLGEPAVPEALHRYPCGVWCRDVGANAVWELGGYRMEPSPILATNDYLHLRSRALGGEVVTELPPFLAANAIEAGKLVALLPEHRMPEQQISLVYPSHRHPSSVVRAYLDFCQTQMSAYLRLSGQAWKRC